MPFATLLLPEFDAEIASARRILGRVPEGRNDWQQHPKSMKLGRLAVHVAELPSWVATTFTQDSLDFAPPGAPQYTLPEMTTTAALVARLEQNAVGARAALAAAPDAALTEPWSLLYGGTTLFTQPRLGVYLSFCLGHLVHHRAQLGVYLRLLNIPIPATYGPSADEQPG
jgi:uncharacterized damage-inducible protein DinB